ncbi:MAG: alpha/beta hydrolase-fold protein, partial [Actinomycetota bacterium]|nr:alpha/beta hydrolase-fold protein [Actinomycetota bacterium]
PSDQYSQIQVTTTPTGGNWIAAAVRLQNNGQNGYVGLYFANNGNPELMLFKRSNGNWSQLSSYASGVLATGTTVTITAVGNTIALLENSTVVASASDPAYSGGAPGVMASGTTTADNWSGGSAGFQVYYSGTDASGISYYDMISANDGYGVQVLRVLQPTHPTTGVPHNFLYVLPVEPGQGSTYGDGLATLQAMDAQDLYNLTIVEPGFYLDPWYANNPNDPNLQYETFMTNDLVPWVRTSLATSGTEQNWLIGFSKSGYGGQDLLLKHPDIFTLAASWDFPADMTSYDQYGSSPAANYGTDANFQANYRLTSSFVSQHGGPFQTANRIWIGGYALYEWDMNDYDPLLTGAGVVHTYGPNQQLTHRWDSGWVPTAMAALYQDSLRLPGG